MTTKSLLIAIVLIAAVVFGLTMRRERDAGTDQPARKASSGPSVPVASSVATPKEPAAATVSAMGASPGAPAWRSAAASSSAGQPVPNDKARGERQARLTAVRRALDKLGPQDRQDPRKVSDMLLSLEQANGSPNVSGIRLDVLRQNLAVAAQLQALTGELQGLRAEVPEGKQPPKELADRIKAKLGQIAAAQKLLRTDFMDEAVVAGNLAAGQ